MTPVPAIPPYINGLHLAPAPGLVGTNFLQPLAMPGQPGALVGAQAVAVDEEALPVPQQPGPGPRSFAARFLECARARHGDGPRPQCGRGSTIGMLAGVGLCAYGLGAGEVEATIMGAGVFIVSLSSSLGLF